MGLRETILKADDLPKQKVEVPEWGVTVWIRTMTGAERDAFESENWKVKGQEVTHNRQNFKARLVGRTLVDENGVRIFNDAQLGELGSKGAHVLDRLAEIAGKLSAISKKDEDEILGNSNAGPSSGNGIVSPRSSDAQFPSVNAA